MLPTAPAHTTPGASPADVVRAAAVRSDTVAAAGAPQGDAAAMPRPSRAPSVPSEQGAGVPTEPSVSAVAEVGPTVASAQPVVAAPAAAVARGGPSAGTSPTSRRTGRTDQETATATGADGADGATTATDTAGATEITEVAVPLPPPLPPALPPTPLPPTGGRVAPAPIRLRTVAPPEGGHGGIPQLRAVAKGVDSFSAEATVVNDRLAAARIPFQISTSHLRDLKKAALVGAWMSLIPDHEALDAFADKAVSMITLGWQPKDGNPLVPRSGTGAREQEAFFHVQEAARQAYAKDVSDALAARMPDAERIDFTYDQWERVARVVTEVEMLSYDPPRLAEMIDKKRGFGTMAGILPGELYPLSDVDRAGLLTRFPPGSVERVSLMRDLGRAVVASIRRLAGTFAPELTGSLVLGLHDPSASIVPNDLDVNVSIDPQDLDVWRTVHEAVKGVRPHPLRAEGVTVETGFFREWPDSPGNVATMFFRVKYTIDGVTRFEMIEVELKNVGGSSWTGKLRANAPSRTVDVDGQSLGQWLLVDTMSRCLAARADARMAVDKNPTQLRELREENGGCTSRRRRRCT